MCIAAKYDFIIHYFLENNIPVVSELNYQNAFQLLIAVVLSAQCTDKRVNSVTKNFFKAYPTVEKLAESSFEKVYFYIKSISYPNNKTKYLLATARILRDQYASEIPKNALLLQKLPGVGRKTAHVILATLYQVPVIAVDTHVFRVSKRLGLVSKKAKTPLAVEKELVKYTPDLYLIRLHHWLIMHGRYICKARNPMCFTCPLKSVCNFFCEK